MTKILSVIQPIPNQKFVWRVEPDECYLILQVLGHVFVE